MFPFRIAEWSTQTWRIPPQPFWRTRQSAFLFLRIQSIQGYREALMKRYWVWLLLLVLPVTSAIASAARLPFIQDDFAKARAEAKKRNVPIFVECWAPW
jgi:hypothetical protein